MAKRKATEGYRVVRGINYPDPANPGKEKRAEPGEIVTDLPAAAIASELESGAIEPADTGGETAPEEV